MTGEVESCPFLHDCWVRVSKGHFMNTCLKRQDHCWSFLNRLGKMKTPREWFVEVGTEVESAKDLIETAQEIVTG